MVNEEKPSKKSKCYVNLLRKRSRKISLIVGKRNTIGIRMDWERLCDNFLIFDILMILYTFDKSQQISTRFI